MRASLPLALPLLLLASPLAAQGWMELERPAPVTRDGAVQRVASIATIEVTGREARVSVEERFRNGGGAVAEASYLYPLPRDAAFGGYSLWQGGTELRGEMLDRERAQAIYEAIVRQRKDPALLTLAGHGLIRSQVFPIAPGETRRVALRYTQLLERAGDALRLRHRLAGVEGDSGAARGARAAQRLTVTIADARELGEPWSPTHRVRAERRGERLEITVEEARGGDLELLLPRRRPVAGVSVLAHAPAGEDGYAMLVLSPPPAGDGPVLPRDLTLVVDVSGSMAGAKLEQARAGLRQALGSLARQDRFRLVAFSSAVREFRRGFAEATPEALDAARRFVDELRADGGTNIAGALDVALDGGARDGERVAVTLLLTDGQPSVGERDPERIAAQAGGRIGGTRVFTLGLGEDVNTYLLDRLAVAGRGSAEYVAPSADVEASMGTLLGRLARPVLTRLRVVRAPVELADRYPAELPDLFDGEELVLLARYRGHGSGPLVIEGERRGRREQLAVEATFPDRRDGDAFVAQLWATRRIGELTRTARLEGASERLIAEIRELGLRHGIITDYTAFLVQEPMPVAHGMAPPPPPPAPPVLDMQLQGGAAAAPLQTGAKAFRRAEASASLARASTVAEAEARAERSLRDAASAQPSATRRVGGRVFVRRGAEWTDVAHAGSVPVVTVAPFSPAYFAVARALPEVARCLAAGDTVLVAGRRKSVRVAAGGAERLAPAELTALVNAFRGT